MERALVTGSTGFVGGHLTQRLLESGVSVDLLVRSNPDRRGAAVNASATEHVVESAADVREAFERSRPDACFHLATHYVAQHRAADVHRLVESNVEFGLSVADAAAAVGCRRFVNAGTAWQHVEGETYRPKNLYAATKQAFDDILVYYARSGYLDVVTLRLFDTYGPADHRGKVLSALFDAARTGVPLAMGDGNQLVDLVHVDDVVGAFLAAVRLPMVAGAPPSRHAIASGVPLTLRDLVVVLDEVLGRAVPVRWHELEPRPDEMLIPWDVGVPVPDWEPAIALRRGLADLAARS